MNRAKSTLLSDITETRSSLVEVLSVAVLLAFGINLISPVVASKIGEIWSAVLGFTLALGAGAYLSYKKLRSRHMSQTISAVFFTERREDPTSRGGAEADPLKIIAIPEYDFGERFPWLAQSLFAENPALERQWRTSPMDDFSPDRDEKASFPAEQIARELVEYIFLEALTVHVTDFFNEDGFDSSRLVKMQREDVPQILLKNRALELFSRNYKDRPGFSGSEDDTDDEYEIQGISYGDYYFNKFVLTLPKGSSAERADDGALSIRSKSMSVTIRVDFNGDHAVIPHDFYGHYMGYPQPFRLNAWQVRVTVEATVKSRVVAYGTDLTYHQWLESFMEYVIPRLDFNQFLEQIKWSTVAGVMHCIRQSSDSASNPPNK